MRSQLRCRTPLWLGAIFLLPALAMAHDRDSAPPGTAVMAPDKDVPSCQPIGTVNNRSTPPALYAAVADCIRHDRYTDAYALFGLAGIYSHFDAERVLDKTAGQAGPVMVLGLFNSLPTESATRFRAEAGAIGADRPALERLCAAVRKVGPPAYYPHYMIQHGMGAVTAALSGKPEGTTVDPNFDAAATWQSLQGSYLNCLRSDALGEPDTALAPPAALAPRPDPVTAAPPRLTPPYALVPADDQSAEAQARCHPGLLPSPSPMPQIDVSGLPDPGIGHMKFHFWVDGSGAVTRAELTAATFGTDLERQSELDYLKVLRFGVPPLPECRNRQMELIADFFVKRGASGRFATFARLYPRNVYSASGVLERRE